MSQLRGANLSSGSVGGLILRAAVITVGLEAVIYYLNLGRGVPWMFALFVALVLVMNYAFTRTKWGRSMRAVGGNAEAARRAGIGVRGIYFSAFVLRSKEHTSELQSLMRISYAVFCLKKKKNI